MIKNKEYYFILYLESLLSEDAKFIMIQKNII